MIEKNQIQGIQWLWMVLVLLFPVAATLMPVAPGWCVSLNHADCPLSPTLGADGAGYDAQPFVRRDSCCSGTPWISRSGGCHCSKGGSFVPGNAPVLFFGTDLKVAPPKVHIGDGARAWSRRRQEHFSSLLRFFSQPVSLGLTMVQVTVLLI